ncbi:histamine H2 receptor-like [Pteropus vampyrus]|uniref:Histamine H2 receptor n=1 Tax=Pteropus vampyrus TaxID=132908 RepID=A0A6P3RRS1_PTEVA|nr:histamine H2 receptor-like [Pteropus vampyrus]
MGAFVVCWFPYFTAFVYRGLKGDDAVNKTFEAVVLWLGYANSALNPILYATLNRDFRSAYQRLLRCSPAGREAHGTSLVSSSSRVSRTQSQEPGRQEEKPLKLQVCRGSEVAASWGATDRSPKCEAQPCHFVIRVRLQDGPPTAMRRCRPWGLNENAARWLSTVAEHCVASALTQRSEAWPRRGREGQARGSDAMS